MEISFRATGFRLFTPIVAQLVATPVITGQATVAFNN
jgi:hypothetical protein